MSEKRKTDKEVREAIVGFRIASGSSDQRAAEMAARVADVLMWTLGEADDETSDMFSAFIGKVREALKSIGEKVEAAKRHASN